ncbi:Leishmanolysin [Novymonas esmeraldas]|uniref:Leishmanolysin-like peptidase n=1 Tax=Novymonas esmeraldas TaxID=1808958 RepID=A0AAW0F1B0_9TRYP
MCTNVKCDTATHTYSVHVYGSRDYVSCTPGQRIALATISNAFQDGGYITCPPYIEVCQSNVQAAHDFTAATRGNGASEQRSARASAAALAALVLVVAAACV